MWSEAITRPTMNDFMRPVSVSIEEMGGAWVTLDALLAVLLVLSLLFLGEKLQRRLSRLIGVWLGAD